MSVPANFKFSVKSVSDQFYFGFSSVLGEYHTTPTGEKHKSEKDMFCRVPGHQLLLY